MESLTIAQRRIGVDVQFDKTLEFIGRIQQAQTPGEACDCLLAVTRKYGLTAVVAGTVPAPGTPPERQREHLLLSNWPNRLLDLYITRNYVDIDPLVAHLADDPAPVGWRAFRATAEGDSIAAEMFSEAEAYGLEDGLAFSLTTLEGRSVIVSLGGKAVELSARDVGSLHLASTLAVGRALTLHGQREEPARPELTPREIECLQWAALGKSEWEISQILGISEHTSEKHLLNAKTKLAAANRVQAVAEAMRHGFIL